MKTRNMMKGSIPALIVVLACALFIVACSPATPSVPTIITNAPQTEGELTRADVIGNGLSSSAITALGVRVGMTEGEVLKILGPADGSQEYDFGAIQNWEYNTALGLNRTGLVLHLRQGIVTRIMVYPSMNDYLVGATKVDDSKEDIYATLGVPDRQYDIKGGRYFVYNSRGLEVFFNSEGESSLGIVFENRKLPTTATILLNANETKPTVPRLIADTTTLCNQGPTFAFNTASGACTAYTNACSIPANEVEVEGCAPEFVTDEAVRNAVKASW